jgi:hypothetical protein
MIFLTLLNIQEQISADQLAVFCKGDLSKLDTYEKSAIQLVESYLSAKYDCAVIFNNSSTYACKELVKELLIDIVIYKAAKANLNPRNIPEERMNAHDYAIKEFDKWASDKRNPQGLPLKDLKQKSVSVKLGSNSKTRFKW